MGFRHVDGYTFFEGSGTDRCILAYTLIKKLLTARSQQTMILRRDFDEKVTHMYEL